MTTDIKTKIQAANEEAVRRMNAAEPVLVDIAPAREVIPGLRDKMILHSGPPVTWDKMCGAQRGAMIGVALFEGWANDAAEAMQMLASGAITFEPNHHHDAVGPMAGTISASMPVWVVENKTFGNRAFCRQVEGRQQFGDYSNEALQALRMWRAVWAPALRRGLQHMGGLPLKPIIAKALQMGDELHNRPVAASSLFANAMIAPMIRAGVPQDDLLATVGLLTNHELLFLGLAMAAGKAIADPARNIEYSTIVTAMCRNGVEFGIRVSCTDRDWQGADAARSCGRTSSPPGQPQGAPQAGPEIHPGNLRRRHLLLSGPAGLAGGRGARLRGCAARGASAIARSAAQHRAHAGGHGRRVFHRWPGPSDD